MLDFLIPSCRSSKKNILEVYPKFKIMNNSEDLMIRGGDFYAVWDEDKGLWSLDESTVIRKVDAALSEYKEKVKSESEVIHVKYMWDADSGTIDRWHKYVQRQMRDKYHQLDEKVIFANSETEKKDYATKRLPYSLEEGDISSYDELMSTLYSEDERRKLEWAIGSIIAGDSKKIQKFIVLYGSAGSGKSTVLNIIQALFEGYYTFFDAKHLGSSNNQFALESFKDNPLVGIQHDGDLSRIEDNTKLNSIVSHESMEINEKFKSKYSAKFNTFLFMGTNKPVRITEAKSGLIRRLIDVHPTGEKIPYGKYIELMSRINFELGGIANHCYNVYRELGEDYYNKYIPKDMISATNDFYDFVESYYDEFNENDATTLVDAYNLYKKYVEYAGVKYPYPMRAVRVELKNYFRDYKEQVNIGGKHLRNYYSGFMKEKFFYEVQEEEEVVEDTTQWLKFEETKSIFDVEYREMPAQYANEEGTPIHKWSNVNTKLKDIKTSELHYVKLPLQHIVIDFDHKDDTGEKSLEANLAKASMWPKTYAELSKSGKGIHLHYIYAGEPEELSRVYEENTEVKVFTGNSSLRRKLTYCNDIPIASINSGLPMKGGKNVVNYQNLKSEEALIRRIEKCLAKEHHGATKPEIDFIFDSLEKAYADGIQYDVTTLRPKIMAFANNSTNQSEYCVKKVSEMKFKSDEFTTSDDYEKDTIIFFDIEVFPNLFVVVAKPEGSQPIKMVNPTPSDIEKLTRFKLVGFNNRRYDNHILYARILGYDNQQLFDLSQKIISGSKNSTFAGAYGLSYTDVYDFSSKKQSLKKWEIELGIHHQELGLKWEEPVPKEQWELVAEYCINDVVATEAVFNHLKQDFVAREILADISGLSVNDSTNSHTTKLIVGDAVNPQDEFVYTDLSETFPGYKFEAGKSTYQDEVVGEGGYVYSEPGMYGNVALLDVASMHPTSAINLNIFGPYTKNFEELVKARLAIKHGDYKEAGKYFEGKLKPYLKEPEQANSLAYALKIAINSVYGLTAARFSNKLKDPRNKDNIVAKRGALFMINLKKEVVKRGYTVAHIKTDSIKIPDANQEIIDFVIEYGKEYGYTFEHETTYDKMCLVNDAVYIARLEDGKWTATGAQFAQPYVFKTLFSKEPIEFRDKCETKTVSTALYLDMNEGLGEDEHDYHFVGKAGSFCPIKKGCGGGLLMREKEGKYHAAAGTKGYRWLESEMVEELKKESDIDESYYKHLVDEAVTDISKYGDFEWFVSEDKYKGEFYFPF